MSYGISGLTGFGPNINIVKDPRYGRNSEVPGEDPFVTAQYAVNYVQVHTLYLSTPF